MKISTIAELDALPIGSIAIDSDCDIMHKAWDPKTDTDFWSYLGNERRASFWLPGFLVHVPGRDLVQEAKAEAWDEANNYVGSAVPTNPYRQEAPSAHPS